MSLHSVAGIAGHMLTVQSWSAAYVAAAEEHDVRGSASLASNSDTACCTYKKRQTRESKTSRKYINDALKNIL